MDSYIYNVLKLIINQGKFNVVQGTQSLSSSSLVVSKSTINKKKKKGLPTSTNAASKKDNNDERKFNPSPPTNPNGSMNLHHQDILFLLLQLLFLHYGYKPLYNVYQSSFEINEKLPFHVGNYFSKHRIVLTKKNNAEYGELHYGFPFF